MPDQKLTAEIHLGALLEAAPDAMIVSDRTGTILLANALMAEMFGYGPAELIGQPIAVLLPLRFRERHDAHQAKFFSHPGKRPMGAGMELLGLRKNGEEFPVEISLSPVETAGGPLVLSAIRDISDRKRAAQKLEQLNRDLQKALDLVKQLSGVLPICAHCKKIRNAQGKWEPIEAYIHERSEAEFTHGFCPDCGRKYYGHLFNPAPPAAP
jgi:PAS domain S-box-containing protein